MSVAAADSPYPNDDVWARLTHRRHDYMNQDKKDVSASNSPNPLRSASPGSLWRKARKDSLTKERTKAPAFQRRSSIVMPAGGMTALLNTSTVPRKSLTFAMQNLPFASELGRKDDNPTSTHHDALNEAEDEVDCTCGALPDPSIITITLAANT
eukprot:7379520-Prymnesium_polylepis.2